MIQKLIFPVKFSKKIFQDSPKKIQARKSKDSVSSLKMFCLFIYPIYHILKVYYILCVHKYKFKCNNIYFRETLYDVDWIVR